MNASTTTNRTHWLLPLFLFFFFSCKKDLRPLGGSQENNAAQLNVNLPTAANSKKVVVQIVDELYEAVNNPVNEGSTIVLAPGTYFLTADHPNSGRLELQHNMSLTGQAGHPEAVIIDVSRLPASSVIIPPTPTFPVTLRTGAVRVGNGRNAIEWLTLQNDPTHNLRSLIQTDLVATPTTQIRIAHTVVKGVNIGISIINRDAVSNGRTVDAELEDNELTGNVRPTFGTGIQIQNSQAVSGATINVVMKGNWIHGNMTGLASTNASAEQSRVSIHSTADRIEDNGLGIALLAGFSESTEFATSNNQLSFEAFGSKIRNNLGTPTPWDVYPVGGIFAVAGLVPYDVQPGTVNHNTLSVGFHGCQIEGNAGPYQIYAYGAFSQYASQMVAGTFNKTILNLDGVSKKATVNAVSSFPAEPAGTNTVFVDR